MSNKSPLKSYGGRIYMAENGFMPQTLSYSGLMTYMKCPRDYYYKYVLGLWDNKWSQAFAFGHTVHAMLETHFNTDGDEESVYQAMINAAKKDNVDYELRQKYPDDKKYEKEKSDFYRMAWGMYKDDVKLIQSLDVLAVEKQFTIPIRDPDRPHIVLPVRLRGVIDLVLKDYTVIDHKTASAFKEDREYEIDHQPYLYAMAIKELYGEYPPAVKFNAMLKRKRDFNSKMYEIDFDLNRLQYVYRDVVHALQGMLLGEWQKGTGKDHYRMCDTCKKYK